MTTFFFRAVATDGKVRTGRLAGETDRFVARELRKQGLTPVYVGTGTEEILRAEAASLRQRPPAGRSVLHAGTVHPAECRRPAGPGAGHHRRADRAALLPRHRARRAARAQGRQTAGRQPGHARRVLFRPLREYGARGRGLRRAGRGLRASVGVRTLARRAAQLHRFRHDLSRAAVPGGTGFGHHPADLRGAAIRVAVRGFAHADAAADANHAGSQQLREDLVVGGGPGRGQWRYGPALVHRHGARDACVGTRGG